MFSKTCEYGIRAAIYVARQSGNGLKVSLKEVSEGINSPVAFTSKILQMLSRSGILLSTKGPGGGYEMDGEQMKSVSLLHVVYAIDGDKVYNGCGLGLQQCDSEKPCPLHGQFMDIRNQLKYMLEGTRVADLAKGLKRGESFLRV